MGVNMYIQSGAMVYVNAIVFGYAGSHHVILNGAGTCLTAPQNCAYTISGSTPGSHWVCNAGAEVTFTLMTITIATGLSYAWFANTGMGSLIWLNLVTFTLQGTTPVGSKFYVYNWSNIMTNTAGNLNFFPGNTAGVTSSSGLYS
jgi:hypothetical protein